MELTIDKGRGYVPAEENKPVNSPIGYIPIDAIFTPIRHVKYTVENFRVEQKTDYEKLILDIKTDGSIHPKNALKEAAKILIEHFALFSDEKITIGTYEKSKDHEFDEHSLRIRQLLKTKLSDMDLSVRARNCLKAADIETLADLISYDKNALLKFRNFGKKSLAELEEFVISKGLNFGMDIAKYGFVKTKEKSSEN
jgi:DNA-directed RNA polymerase subunit alpha